jgi:hypothetical protein
MGKMGRNEDMSGVVHSVVEPADVFLRPDGSAIDAYGHIVAADARDAAHPVTPEHVATCGDCQDQAGW